MKNPFKPLSPYDEFLKNISPGLVYFGNEQGGMIYRKDNGYYVGSWCPPPTGYHHILSSAFAIEHSHPSAVNGPDWWKGLK